MPVDAKRRLDTLRSKVSNGERGDESDRELLLKFADRMALQQYSDERIEKLLRHCVIMSEQLGPISPALEDRDVAENIVHWINRTYENEETNRDYRVALRIFGKHVTDDSDEIPDSLEWITSSTSRNYNPAPDPAEMLSWEDVNALMEATINNRDAALMAVAFDAGPRAGELLNLRVGDVTDHDYGLQITVDGKTGQRSITLIPSVPHLNQWLADHPRSNDDTAPLWCKLQSGEEISYQMARKIPREAADRSDISKPVTFTNFRKSSASHLASRGVNQAVLEDHHGWKQGSDVASQYVSVFADASDRELAKAHGLDVEDKEPDPTAAVTCSRCGEKTPREEPFCMWCNQALEHGAVDEIKAKETSERRALMRVVKENPELIDRLEEMEPLIGALGGNTNIVDTARRFVEAADADT